MAIGERIAAKLKKGSIVALRGTLGAGKTCLAKGIGRFLGIDEEITSPTYTIISEYTACKNGPLPFYHIDAYRLEGDEDFIALGGEEALFGEGISVVEWSERLGSSIPAGAIAVTIALLEDGSRRITVEGLETLE
jgi:tRNA threonylcarbamoyladenosine biosynthesis protein TsaE